ncbi:MAG: ribbon-helix-helix domain-containing protein [Candidatus Thermoplasmatota archaeon]|nr:ribbon-helix-helix domain-containing protein [Candidatus Thermoplasmatota archaeon]
MKTISLKVTPELAELIAEAARQRGFPSKSEFVRYVLARALEEELSLETIEEIFLSRRQIREGKSVPMSDLLRGE